MIIHNISIFLGFDYIEYRSSMNQFVSPIFTNIYKSFLNTIRSKMFKKPIKISAQNQLSGKDRKTIKSKLSTIVNPDCVEQLLNKNDKIVSCKVTGSKMIIYQGNQYPILVDGTGKSDLFPSLYAMQAYEPILKYLYINEGVEAYIYNGANLMWPGVSSWEDLGGFKKDQVVGVRNAKGEVVGVGAMGCSKKQFLQNQDKSGIAVYILHYKGDKLWESGPKTVVDVVMKDQSKKEQESQKYQELVEAEKQKQKQKKQEKQQKKQQKLVKQVKQEKKQQKKKKQLTPQKKSEESEEESSDDEVDLSNLLHTSKPREPEVKVEKKQKNKAVFSDQEQDNKKGRKKGGKKNADKKKNKAKKSQDVQEDDDQQGEKKQEQAPKSIISAKLMDQYLKQCFLNALKLSHVQKQLPIDSGRFYLEYMLLARPEGVKLQVKDSTYKKLGKFLEDMSKHKFIQYKHNKDKKGGQQGALIVKILYDNQEFKDYEPTIPKMNVKQVEQKQQQDVNNPNAKKKKLNLSKSLDVTTVYKPSEQLKKFIFPKTINYIPTEQQEQQLNKQKQQHKNLPEYFSENDIKSKIQERINNINENKAKNKDKADKDKTIAINYKSKNNPVIVALASILKKEIQDFEENAVDEQEEDSDEEEQKQEKNKKKKQKKKGVRLLRIDRGVLINKLLKKCSTAHRIVDQENGVDTFKQGAFKGIHLVAEKANNKNITKITNLQAFITPKQQADEQLNGFSAFLQKKFACSVNLQNLPGKNAGKEIIVHGNFIIELEEILVNEYQIDREYIKSQNKLDKKKKQH